MLIRVTREVVVSCEEDPLWVINRYRCCSEREREREIVNWCGLVYCVIIYYGFHGVEWTHY